MSKYQLFDGHEVSKRAIVQAFRAGRARLVCSRSIHGRVPVKLRIDGQDIDTRGRCYSVLDEVWTIRPQSLQECLVAAAV